MILCGLAAALIAPAVVRADRGHQDGPYAAGTSGSPTTSKPESKVWFSHRKWWAVMARKVATGGNTYFIFRLNPRTQRWVNTHVEVDTRDSTRQDALAVGSKLFIASHKSVDVTHNDATPDPKDEMRLYLFSYSSGAHRYLPAATPYQVIDGQKSEALVIDRDSTGAIWATWVQETGGGQHQVYVRQTDGNCIAAFANCTFTGPTVTLDDVSPDDISSVVRFGGNKVGVMWSDTRDVNDDKLMFAIHQDGDPVNTWSTETAIHGRKMADDHINLKADSKGRIFAATKTKFSGSTKPGTMLLRRSTAGSWKHYTVSRGSLDHTRPIVLLDQRHNRIRVFEGSTHKNAVFMKKSRLSRPSFPVLKAGARVIKDDGSEMVNPTSTKQLITQTHFVVLATNPETKRYWHAWVGTRH